MSIFCHYTPTSPGESSDLQFALYRDETILYQFSSTSEWEFSPAKAEHSGYYSCAVRTWNREQRSDAVYIEIPDLFLEPVIKVKQNPITEGDPLSLTCYTLKHKYGNNADLEFSFYKMTHGAMQSSSISDLNAWLLQLSLSNEYEVPFVQLQHSGNYFCDAETSDNRVYKRSSTVTIQITELFSRPEVKVSPSPLAEGSNMTITCDTALHPSRRSTQLQFAFYVNGSTVQKFSLSKKYQVYSVVPKDLGDYSCAAATPTVSILKISKVMKIQIQDRNYTVQNKVRLAVSAFIFLLASCLLFYGFKRDQQMEPKSRL
ncbi:high affinity immunoglobulin gamma Fc receptor I [Xenopus laevis]|uniref:high affinity immunoglobulin gamma Fc receptor I n=1 Tax=Xenopus laevis TaxID=8355 RepID=UPI00084DD9FC|nr:high affinity immunoglobulin gamma Fc receptor I [Xenopus laevis]